MDLHSGTPFWPLRNGLLATYPALDRPVETTVAIVGAGITGALVAHYLAKSGVDCVVLDRRDAASGSTAASTALLQYEIDVPLRRLAQLVGEEHAARAYRICHHAIDKLERLTLELGHDVEFKRVRSLQGASRQAHVPGLREELAQRTRLGFAVDFWDARRLQSQCALPFPAALISHQAAQLDPHRLTATLLTAAAARGTRIYDRTAVARWKPTRLGVELVTSEGHRIRAQHLVNATGYETAPWLPDNLVKMHSTYALVTEPIAALPGWPEGHLVWETARPYTYMRRTADDRLLIGGGDEPFLDARRRDALLSAKTTTLSRRLRRLLPDARCAVDYSWCGAFAETADGLPFIGRRDPGAPVYHVLGYGGNGITFSLIAAEVIRDLVLEGASAAEDLFRFDRPSAKFR